MGKPKLKKNQWESLYTQYSNTPDLNESDGDEDEGGHYVLIALLNLFGYYPRSREAAMRIAQELLELDKNYII